MASSGDRLEIITDPITAALKSFLETTAGEALSFLWDQTGGPFFSMILLSSKADYLHRETGYLINRKEDTLNDILRGRRDSQNPTNAANTWLEEVDKLEIAEKKFQESFEQISCCFPWLYFFLARDVQKLLKEVLRLKTQRTDLTVLCEAMPNPVLLQSTSTFPFTDMESISKEIREWLYDEDDSEIIGIYGMGGVGKTTLLKAINNELCHAESGRFDLVIFVTVSKDVDMDRIQKEIGERLGYGPEFSDQDIGERATRLSNDLSKKKFILLLDDLWAELKLGEVGVPLSPISRKGSKVAITTRSAQVCDAMGAAARKVKVPVLNWVESWELLCKSMGKQEEKMAESIIPLANATAKECGGLPLAITAVGRAMANVHSTGGWEEALAALPEVVEGMKGEVLPTLKLSFDRLSKIHKECLLYCSLFPEDAIIEVRDIIDLWVGEGFFEKERDSLSLHSARIQGEIAIDALKAVCLLEDGEVSRPRASMKLHYLVREMALWITSGDCEEDTSIFLVARGKELARVPMPERWPDVTRISLMENETEQLSEIPKCENLRTLFLRRYRFWTPISSEFFPCIPFLTVLDLSGTNIEFLPNEIGLLVELQYLNLSCTPLRSLPKEVGSLKKLKILDLRYVHWFEGILEAALSPLSYLQSLKVKGTHFLWEGGWTEDDINGMDRGACLKTLNGLTRLEELDVITISSREDWLTLSDSPKLFSIIKHLVLSGSSISSIDLSHLLGTPNKLVQLIIDGCLHLERLIFPAYRIMNLEELKLSCLRLERISFSRDNAFVRNPAKDGACFQNLINLEISKCGELQDITWIRELPCLEILRIERCDKMVEIIKSEESVMNGIMEERDPSFPRLRIINLDFMNNLIRISSQALLFPSLEELTVNYCRKLKRLPFGHLSARNMTRLILNGLHNISCVDLSRNLGTPNKLVQLIINGCSHLERLIFPTYQIMKLERLQISRLPLERISFSPDNASVRNLAKDGACFQNLNSLEISKCGELRDITWIRELPCLEFLRITHCAKMVEIIKSEKSDMNGIMEEKDSSFPRLCSIYLESMKKLISISGQALLFPSLHALSVNYCPKLKRLPLGHLSAKNMTRLILKELRNIACLDLSRNLGSPNKLVQLIINGCSHLEQLIFPADQIMKLEELVLSRLPLERISFRRGNASAWKIAKDGACFQNLKRLDISKCGELQDITWIRELPCLEFLRIERCDKMVEIIKSEESVMNGIMEERDLSFPSLRIIYLEYMKNLISISNQALLFPSLHELRVNYCPKLKKLPFGHLSAKNIKIIKGEDIWWDNLEWSDPSIQSIFTQCVVLKHIYSDEQSIPFYKTEDDEPTESKNEAELDIPSSFYETKDDEPIESKNEAELDIPSFLYESKDDEPTKSKNEAELDSPFLYEIEDHEPTESKNEAELDIPSFLNETEDNEPTESKNEAELIIPSFLYETEDSEPTEPKNDDELYNSFFLDKL